MILEDMSLQRQHKKSTFEYDWNMMTFFFMNLWVQKMLMLKKITVKWFTLLKQRATFLLIKHLKIKRISKFKSLECKIRLDY